MHCVKGKKVQELKIYPLQMKNIPDRPFDKIAIDLVSGLNISTSGNQHILSIIDHLTGRPKDFPIPNNKTHTIVCVFINIYIPIHVPLLHTVRQ